MKTIYLATNNTHKVEELSDWMNKTGLPFRIASAKELGGMPEVVEDQLTFEGNATLKAAAIACKVGDGNYSLADDSGIEVDALDGGPGIYSARFAGEGASDLDNLNKLIGVVQETPLGQRGAGYFCCLVLMDSNGKSNTFEGVCRGKLIETPMGDHGFGYDPIFIPEGYGNTFGELNPEIKAGISHRVNALVKLRSHLEF